MWHSALQGVRMNRQGLLSSSRVYLSGPLDFVASRADEKKLGWPNRVGDFLRELGSTVFDPWFKPAVRGLEEYGLEDVNTVDTRQNWTFEPGQSGDEARVACIEQFWETLHIDLRMVDTSDFTIAYCPTNIYSVGTAHEIILTRQQMKPVLFVSPPVTFPTLDTRELVSRTGDVFDGTCAVLLAPDIFVSFDFRQRTLAEKVDFMFWPPRNWSESFLLSQLACHHDSPIPWGWQGKFGWMSPWSGRACFPRGKRRAAPSWRHGSLPRDDRSTSRACWWIPRRSLT